MATIDDIKQRAQQVQDATEIGENTAARVGGVLVDLADHVEQVEDDIANIDVTFSTGQKVSEVGIDNAPTSGSNNLVKSGGVYQEIVGIIGDETIAIGDMTLLKDGMNIGDTQYSYAPNVSIYLLDLTGKPLNGDGNKGTLDVTANTGGSWFALMKSYNTPVANADIGTFATGYSARIVIEPSMTGSYMLPADCNYILFVNNQSAPIFPVSIHLIHGFTYEEFEALKVDVNKINNEIYIGGNHQPSSVNSSGAALTGTFNNGVLTLTQNTAAVGFVSTDINTNGVGYKIKFKAKLTNGSSQVLFVGFAASVLSDATKSVSVNNSEYADYELSLDGIGNGNEYLISFTVTRANAHVGNIISIKDIVVTFDGENASVLERLDKLEQDETSSGGLGYTFNTEAFLQGCDRYSKYLTKICCAGDSLIANAIGGSIPSSVDEGADNRRPMRLLTNGVARRLYDYISWNKPTWRRLDHSDWTKSGWSAFTNSQMNTICQGINPGLWKSTAQGSYAEITIPQGYEHFAIIVRLKSGNGTLNVTLNGGAVGTYTNPYYTSKVATNSVVNASVVPPNIARGLSTINTNSGTTVTGNIYHIVEYNNLPSGQANTFRFTTASATEVDIWGGFYWSGNTCVVMNIAQGGHTTSDLLNDHLPDELFAEDYDAVLFEVTEMNNLRLSLEQTTIDMQIIINRLREMGVDHCFTSCNPLGLSIEHDTNFYANYLNPSQLDINNAVSGLLKEQAEAFIDIFQYFRWHIERRGGTLLGGQGGLWYTWDGQHGNDAGVKLWFDALIKVIADKSIMVN